MNKLLLTLLSLIALSNNIYGMQDDVVMADVKVAAEPSSGGDSASEPARKKFKAASGAPIVIAKLISGEKDAWHEGTVSKDDAKAAFKLRKEKIRQALRTFKSISASASASAAASMDIDSQAKASAMLKKRKRALREEIRRENLAAAGDQESTETETDAETRALAKEFEEFVEIHGTDRLDQLSSLSLNSDAMSDGDSSSSNSSESESNNKISCPICEEKFNNKKACNRHINVKHKNIPRDGNAQTNHLCDFPGCTYKANYPNELAIHKKRHFGIKGFTCSEAGCNKSFPSHADLKKHEKRHTQKGKYTCKICGIGFDTSKSVSVHMSSHSNHNLKCRYGCTLFFNRSQDRATHERFKHQK